MYKVAVEYNENAKYPGRGETDGYIKELVKNSFADLELDKENYGTESWNPLGKFIKPGDLVVIKPNLVMHKNYRKGFQDDTDCVFTNPSVVRAVLDYVIIALDGKGKIIIGDAPVQECDFDELVKKSGYEKMVENCKQAGIDIVLKDFRGVISRSDHGVLHQSEKPSTKHIIVKLDSLSEFSDYSKDKLKRIRITNYNPDELINHHNSETHEYCIAEDILKADCIINMPKPKTHKKAGITACLKNLVGINCRKEYLPHHTTGSLSDGGDEYNKKSKIKESRTKNHDKFCFCVYNKRYLQARFYQAVILAQDYIINRFYSDRTSFGSWSGNNTISKTTIDLNRIALYADKNGVIKETPQRTFFNVADMIVSGEHNGPMAPASRPVGMILAGENSFAADLVIARLMRAKVNKIPTLNCCSSKNDRLSIYNPNEDITLISNDAKWNGISYKQINESNSFSFKSPDDWEECFEQ